MGAGGRWYRFRHGIVLMLRFPYRRVWAELSPAVGFSPRGLLSRLIRFLTGQSAQTRQPIPHAGDTFPRPFVSVRIKGPLSARRLRSALLDTGCQDTLFPMALAQPLGIVLGGERKTIKWRGRPYWVEFHDVELELKRNEVVWRWRVRVGFTPAPLSYALLGQRGCLEFLDAKFCGADQAVELEMNRLFPPK